MNPRTSHLLIIALILAFAAACERRNAVEPAEATAQETRPPAEKPVEDEEPEARPATGPRPVELHTDFGDADPPPENPLGLHIEALSGFGAESSALRVPGNLEHRDVLDVDWTPERDRLVVLLRPGDVRIESSDGGRTFKTRTHEEPLTQMAPGNTLWWGLGDVTRAGIAEHLMRSRDSGRSFKHRPTREDMPPPVALETHERSVVLAAGDHLLVSDDWGETWRYEEPALERPVTALHIASDGTRWVASAEGRVAHHTERRREPYRRIDLPPDAGTPHALTSHPDHPDHILAATSNGLWSLDASAKKRAWTRVESAGRAPLHGALFTPDALLAFGPSARLVIGPDTEHLTDVTDVVRHQLGLSPLDAVELPWRFATTHQHELLLFGDAGTIVRITQKVD